MCKNYPINSVLLLAIFLSLMFKFIHANDVSKIANFIGQMRSNKHIKLNFQEKIDISKGKYKHANVQSHAFSNLFTLF